MDNLKEGDITNEALRLGTWSRGRLVVLEGPDGVGKTTLAASLTAELQEGGTPCAHIAFPGREPGSLGSLVHSLHHEPTSFGVLEIHRTSLQVLHVAAHIDAIERYIVPALDAGTTVVLDRYWWSTWVYGLESGIPRFLLQKIIDLERTCWANLIPDAIFLLSPPQSLRSGQDKVRYRRLQSLYIELARGYTETKVYTIRDPAAVDEEVTGVVRMLSGETS